MKYIAIIEDDIPIGDMVEAILKTECSVRIQGLRHCSFCHKGIRI